jgi:hypothetical protein
MSISLLRALSSARRLAGPARRARLGALASALALTLTALASVAHAQTRVRVEIRGGDATVTLTAEGEGRTYRCRTQNGSCAMEGVETGPYIATAEPAGEGRAPAPRRVMVAGSGGEVTVHLRLR